MRTMLKLTALLTLALPGLSLADESWVQLEEVTVVGAVRSSDAVKVADIDTAADEQLQDMPVAYE